jgi:hypothetical protein
MARDLDGRNRMLLKEEELSYRIAVGDGHQRQNNYVPKREPKRSCCESAGISAAVAQGSAAVLRRSFLRAVTE